MSLSIATIDDAGVLNDVAPISVTDGAAVSHTVTAKKKGVLFMNVGNNICWFGGATVDADASRGVILLPRGHFLFRNVTSDFAVFFQCETGGSTTIGVVEYA